MICRRALIFCQHASSYRTNELSYTVRSANGGLAVFSEVWYGPDWGGDGRPCKEVPHVRAGYARPGAGRTCRRAQGGVQGEGRGIQDLATHRHGRQLVGAPARAGIPMELRPAKAELSASSITYYWPPNGGAGVIAGSR